MPAFLQDWLAEPTVLAGVAIAALLYWRGVRYSRRAGLARHLRWWHSVAFGLGLVATLVALSSPISVLSSSYLWAHMVSHELLTMVAAPLLLLGTPAWPVWRAVPLPWRRTSLGWVLRQRWPRRVWHAVSLRLFHPAPALVLFVGVFSLWHVRPLYDAALRVEPLHVLEHMLFLGTALLFWVQVIPSRPAVPKLSYVQRLFFVGLAGMCFNVIGSAFVFSTGPFYPYYVALPRAAGAITPLVDQHLAGAAMDIPSTIIFFCTMSVLLWLWLREDERAELPVGTALARQRV